MSVIFVDTETTGLDPERHEVWDIALIEEDGAEHEYHIRPKLPGWADPTALRLVRFYERTSAPDWSWATGGDVGITLLASGNAREIDEARRFNVAADIAFLTAGRHLVGAVPSFDAAFLSKFLIANGQREAWHYHLIDVETLIAGRLGLRPPLDSEDLSRAIGVDPEMFARHTAIGDARWVREQYEAVYDPGAAVLR